MSIFELISNLVLWAVAAVLAFVLLGALRALALLHWRVEQLEATTPSRLGRSGLRPGTRAPDFTLPTIFGGEISSHDYANRKSLFIFMQPGCGPCNGIVSELNRLHDAGEVHVLAIHNGAVEAVREWTEHNQARFPVAVQDHFSVSKRYEAFATPFGFLVDERGVISGRGIVSTKQFLGFVLDGSSHEAIPDKKGDAGDQTFPGAPTSSVDVDAASLPDAKALDHV